MPSTNKTSKVGLNQWHLNDRPHMNDFNEDNRLLDEAIIVPVAFTINATAWQSSTAYPGYEFQAILSVPGVTPGDLIRADFDLTSIISAEESVLAAAGSVSANSAIFYAKANPGVDLTGIYTVYKGVN